MSAGTFAAAFGVALLLLAAAAIYAAVAHLPSNPAYHAQPDRRMAWLGDSAALTERQYRILVDNHRIAVLNPHFASYDLARHFAAVEHIASLNKQVRVFAYYQALFWDVGNAPRPGHAGWGGYASGFDSAAWYLKDTQGLPIPFLRNGTVRGYLVDLANPAYRAFAISRVQAFMERAPYAGVIFDSADPLGAGASATQWNRRIGPVKTAEWNAGLVALLTETRAALAPRGRIVLYNGISTSPHRDADRNQGLLAVTDGATNESFCFEGTNDPAARDRVLFHPFTEDAAVMRSHPDKILLQFTNYLTPETRINKVGLGRYCLAGFLMGWVPGVDYWRFAKDYEDDLSYQLPEMDLALGRPRGGYQQRGGLLWRYFDHGVAYVNTGAAPVTLIPPAGLVPFADGRPGAPTRPGGRLTIGATSAALFLSERYLRPGR